MLLGRSGPAGCGQSTARWGQIPGWKSESGGGVALRHSLGCGLAAQTKAAWHEAIMKERLGVFSFASIWPRLAGPFTSGVVGVGEAGRSFMRTPDKIGKSRMRLLVVE